MKRGAFELGGSDPFIVCDDADLELASSKAIKGRLTCNGQACNNAKRFIIHDKIYDEFVGMLIHKVKEYVSIGDPMNKSVTIGPLSMQKQVETLTRQVQHSINKGARVLYGDLNYRIHDAELKNGFYFNPMIMENITKDQAAYCEELFGPVFSIFSYSDHLEAVELANATCYGLSASVFTRDPERARRKALQLDVGNVFVNDFVSSDSAIPGGGVKDSGYGRECYKDGIHETINRKAIVFGN